MTIEPAITTPNATITKIANISYTTSAADGERLRLILETLREQYARDGRANFITRIAEIAVEQWPDSVLHRVNISGPALTAADQLELAGFCLGVEYGAAAALGEVQERESPTAAEVMLLAMALQHGQKGTPGVTEDWSQEAEKTLPIWPSVTAAVDRTLYEKALRHLREGHSYRIGPSRHEREKLLVHVVYNQKTTSEISVRAGTAGAKDNLD